MAKQSDTMPLYPNEQQIAQAVVGPERARVWDGIATVLERSGFPRVDPQFGGRYWPAVKAYLDRRHGIAGMPPPPDKDIGEENWDAPRRQPRASRART